MNEVKKRKIIIAYHRMTCKMDESLKLLSQSTIIL